MKTINRIRGVNPNTIYRGRIYILTVILCSNQLINEEFLLLFDYIGNQKTKEVRCL